jgi:phospholipase C
MGAAAALAKSAQALAGTRQLVERAAAVRAAGSDLGAVEHVVFLMMENRSYDHYFGTYEKGRGFDDHPAHRLGRFAQRYPLGTELDPASILLPFRMKMPRDECTRDLTHNWGPQHKCWNHGKMNRWVKVHTSDEG